VARHFLRQHLLSRELDRLWAHPLTLPSNFLALPFRFQLPFARETHLSRRGGDILGCSRGCLHAASRAIERGPHSPRDEDFAFRSFSRYFLAVQISLSHQIPSEVSSRPKAAPSPH
jgi:hypothetical protein